MKTWCGVALILAALVPASALAGDDGLPAACLVPSYYIVWDTCYLQTQVGTPPGWLIDQSATTDNCWYHCYHAVPGFPPSEYEAFHHGQEGGINWMRCATGQSYVPGRRGFDCVDPLPTDPDQ